MITPHSTMLRTRPSDSLAGGGSGSARNGLGATGSPPASSTFTRCILSRPPRRPEPTGHQIAFGAIGQIGRLSVASGRRRDRSRVPPPDTRGRGPAHVLPLRRVHHDGGRTDLQEDP